MGVWAPLRKSDLGDSAGQEVQLRAVSGLDAKLEAALLKDKHFLLLLDATMLRVLQGGL